MFWVGGGSDIVAITEISADGFAYNLGLGITKFISNTIAFEITARYQGGKLTGDNDLFEVEKSEVVFF